MRERRVPSRIADFRVLSVYTLYGCTLNVLVGALRPPAAELHAAIVLLVFGGVLNGVALLELSVLKGAGLDPLLWVSPARWTSEAMLGLEARAAPPGALSTIGLWAYLERHSLATALLSGAEAEGDLMWRCVGAMVAIGTAFRVASLLVVAQWRPHESDAHVRAGGAGGAIG